MRRFLRLAAVATISAVFVAWLIGMTLPVGHTATSSACLPASRSAVWDAVTAVEDQPEWRSGLEAVEPLTRTGTRAWREVGTWGAVTMEAVSATPESRFVGRIAPDQDDFGGTWTYVLSDCPDGTRLTITEDGEIYNPVFRALSRFVWGHHATQEQYLTDLGQHFGADVAVERIE